MSREVHPAEKTRFRFERPFTEQSASGVWQYGTRILKAGEIIETREWPHPSFFPLNYTAQRVHGFFTTRQKSRLALAPFAGDRHQLDGLSGPADFPVSPPKLIPMDLRPVKF